jgi:hypothetical protein
MTTFLAAMLVLVAAAPAATDLDPAHTYVVIAGVLQWQQPGVTGWPTKHRKDEELRDVLLKRGVPAAHMAMLLDEQATFSRIKRAIHATCRKAAADADATFIIYYCGHGGPSGGNDTCFMNYDVIPSDLERTGLLASDLAAMVGKDFKGKRVLFLADCCYSGGMAKAAETLAKSGLQAASLTSADSTVASTGNWTFTQTVIDALEGSALADKNGDGVITLDELAGEVGDAMKYLEHQRNGYAKYGLPGSFRIGLAKAGDSPKGANFAAFRIGDYVAAPDDSGRRAGRVVGVRDGKLVVQFYDYSEKRTVEVAVAKVAKMLPDGMLPLLPGEKPAEIEVEWQGRWYPATVVKIEGAKTHIHYVGFPDSEDEWVTKERIRKFKKG